MITLERAVEIVLELARGNIIEDPDLDDINAEQVEAVNTVEDFFVNHVWG
jgi:hypothetical protein